MYIFVLVNAMVPCFRMVNSVLNTYYYYYYYYYYYTLSGSRWQSGISERFACMRSLVQFLPAPGAAFPEVAVFTVVMGEFLDLASWSAVMQWTFWGMVMGFRNKSHQSAVSSYFGH